jgi:hypothetical protein
VSGLIWSGLSELDEVSRGGYVGMTVDPVVKWLRRSDLFGDSEPFEIVNSLDRQSTDTLDDPYFRIVFPVEPLNSFSQLDRLDTMGCNGAMLRCERFEACRAL